MSRVLPLLLALSACVSQDQFEGTLDTPGLVTVLDPTAGGRFADATGPFTSPVGYVADRHGGRIRLLDLYRGRYLADRPVASFFRGSGLATGRNRVLGEVAVTWTDTTSTVHVVDQRRRQLLSLPHVVGLDANGVPERVDPTATVTWSGAGTVVAEGLRLSTDAAAQETWTFTWNGTTFDAFGSESGADRAVWPDTGWTAIGDGLSFVARVEGTPAVGDTLTIDIERGDTALQLPGAPLDVSVDPTGTWAALLIGEPTANTLRLQPAAELGSTLPTATAISGAIRPVRLAWTADGDALYAADAEASAVHRLDPATSTATTLPMPWPVEHVAVLDTDAGRQLYVVPLGEREIWLYDETSATFVDINPWTPDVDPMRFLSPINGLASQHEPYTLPDDDTDTAPVSTSVAVSLHGGRVQWMAAKTGCLVADILPPRTQLVNASTSIADYEVDYDLAIPGTAYLQATEDSARHVQVNPCAGLAVQQSWRLRFDANAQAWRVEGSLSGEQDGLAYEDQRYVSDDGEIAFLLRSGPTASEDGWTILFDVVDGILEGNGNDGDDLVREIDLDNPGPPAVFYAMDEVDDTFKPWVVVSAQAADFVARVDATTGLVDAIWD